MEMALKMAKMKFNKKEKNHVELIFSLLLVVHDN